MGRLSCWPQAKLPVTGKVKITLEPLTSECVVNYSTEGSLTVRCHLPGLNGQWELLGRQMTENIKQNYYSGVDTPHCWRNFWANRTLGA